MKKHTSIDILDYKDCYRLANESTEKFYTYREKMKRLKNDVSIDIRKWRGKEESQDVCRRATNFVRALDGGLSVCNRVCKELGLDEMSIQKNATARLAQVLITILGTPKEEKTGEFRDALLEELDSILEACES